MSEFIGARISLISKSDIRYVGTLVEINSEQSTVSLDNVRSFGSEGRRGGKDEFPASDAVYEQIVFRGSDVKDLRIEEQAKDKPAQPAMPDDPAIIGVPQQQARPDNTPADQQRAQQPQQPQNFPPQHGQFPPGYPPYGGPFNRFPPQAGFPGGPGGPGGPGPFPPGYGMPGPYGAPPGWYPPGGQGFNQPPGPFSPSMPIGPPGQQHPNQPPNQPPQGPKGGPNGPPPNKDGPVNVQPRVAEADGAAKSTETKPAAKASGANPASTAASKQPPPPPVDSKPDVAAALAPPAAQPTQPSTAPKATPTGPKGGRIVPAIPLASPNVSKTVPYSAAAASSAGQIPKPGASAASSHQDATQAATAAVAAAMAKLNMAGGQVPAPNRASGPLDNLTQKVNEMRADDQIRHGRQPGTGGYAAGNRGARGGRGRGGHNHTKMEVPTTDFDFQSANAKFNKQELVKEAIASGSPLGETPGSTEAVSNGHADGATEEKDVVIPPASAYDRGTSFFDNISSELKDWDDVANRRGQEFRTEERRKNMETFGQGSVDGFRGGYRGRGRGGRGRGRGFGGGFRGRGGPRGRGGSQLGPAVPVPES